jgi:hypothetical protein
MFHFLSLRKNIDSTVAAAAGCFIIFLFTRHNGIGVGPDSVAYFSAAENFHFHQVLTDFANHPFVIFPALYPLFLSGLMLLTGLKPLVFAPVVNALLFAMVIYISGCMMEGFRHPSKWYKRTVLSCIVLSPALLEVYSMAWSETVFILLVLLFTLSMHRYFQSYSRRALIAAAVIAALASVTRYAGITVIGMGGILILADMKMPYRRKLTGLLLYSAISPLLLLINLLRNYFATGTGTGMRERSDISLAQNMHYAGSVFNSWLPFLQGHNAGAGWLAFFIIAALAFLILKQYRRFGRLTTYENIAAAYSLLYLVFMVVTASISRFEEFDSRFFSPVYIFLIWSLSSWLITLAQRTAHVKRKWVLALGAVIFLSFQYGQLDADYETFDGVKDAGIPGYTEDGWRYSPTVQFIEKDTLLFRKGYTVYSNANDAIYFFTGNAGKYLPHKEYKPAIQKFLNDRHCFMVWFNDGEDADLVDMAFITHVKKMKLLKQFDDGAVYEYSQ